MNIINGGAKIAVYGLSTETERELPKLNNEYNIIGLLDSFKTDGEVYGFPIVSLNYAIDLHIEKIIVIARPGSCKAIAKKIGSICRVHNIELYDIRGIDLLQEKKVVYDFSNIIGYKKSDLIEKIRQAEVVSFDLFDTLIMRRVISFTDVIELVQARLKQQNIVIRNFCEKRIAAEKELSQVMTPKLADIYKLILSEYPDLTAEALAELEYKTDCSLILGRQDMIDLIKVAKKLGKSVYITSDSYYSKTQIEKLLLAEKITDYDGVLVSCEHNTGKMGKLFDKLIEVSGTKNILHIGDDIVADIESANRKGIRSFHIYSGEKLFDEVGGLTLKDCINNLSDKIKVGMFVARIFNSPFQFEEKNSRIHVEDAKDIGYLFCAPIMNDFTEWLGQQIVNQRLKNVLFSARDGYLIRQLFEIYYPDIRSDYFLTSRTSAIRAGVESKKDIEYVDSMKYSGSVEESLYSRFGICAEDIMVDDLCEDGEGLLKYERVILQTAKQKKKNNQKYIESLMLEEGGIALFDFIAKGTTQMYTQRIVSNQIIGFYFMQLETDFMRDKGLLIKPFYDESERETSVIFDNYYILETILTAPEPSVDEFDSDGNAVYAKETRTSVDIECIMRTQNEILRYTKEYLEICPRSEINVNKRLDEKFLGLIHNIEILDKDFLELIIEDPFFNRMTNITDVL